MNALSELLEFGFHDAKISVILFDFIKKSVQVSLSVGCEEISKSDNGYDVVYRDGKLTFTEVRSCNIDGAYDFKNPVVILEGEIDKHSCNFYLSSDQSVIIKSKKVEFAWI